MRLGTEIVIVGRTSDPSSLPIVSYGCFLKVWFLVPNFIYKKGYGAVISTHFAITVHCLPENGLKRRVPSLIHPPLNSGMRTGRTRLPFFGFDSLP